MDRITAQGQAFGVIAAAQYVDRMTIQRRKSTKGPTGGNIPADPEVLAENVPCRITPTSASEKELVGQTTETELYTVKAPAFQGSELIEIDAQCEIVIAAREGGVAAQTLICVAPLPNNGLTFEVVATK